MKASRRLNRRSFAFSVLGGVLISGSATAFLAGRAAAQGRNYTGVTDCDSGGNHDSPGYGSGERNQYSDSDTGPNSDPRCHGRPSNNGSPTGTEYHRYTPRTGCSDQDRGQYGDPSGYGRACRGRDPNPNASQPSGCTDSDSGPSSDPGGDGHRCSGH